MTECRICHSSSARHYRRVEGYSLNKCNSCGIVFLEGQSDNQNDFFEDLELHQGMEYWSTPEHFQKHNSLFLKYFRKRAACLRKFSRQKESLKLLDIGSGFGFWPKYAQDNGFSVTCLEPNQKAAQYISGQLGVLNTRPQKLEDFETNEKFDCITLCDVLEHAPDPGRMLERIKSFMRQDSLLYIQVPDALGFRYPYNAPLGLPQHLWQFNTKSLNHLVKANGLSPQKRLKGVMGIVGIMEQAKFKPLPQCLSFLAEKLYFGNRLVMICKING